jgi:cell division protein FtsL
VRTSARLLSTSHDARQRFAELDRARNEQGKLDAEIKRLEAEREAQATSLRVDRVARERLAMRPAHAGVMHYVTDPRPAASEVAR